MSRLPLLPLLRRLAAAAVVALAPAVAHAVPFSDLFFFGDSLSDSGNVYRATGHALPGSAQPYAPGRYSDGPVWTEQFAALLGRPAAAAPHAPDPLDPWAVVGNNYAYAGSRTGLDSTPPGILLQTAFLWGGDPATMADPNALYVVVGGGNDMRDARSAPGADDASRQLAAEQAIGRLQQSVGFLASRGAKHILVSNLPNLALTPEAMAMGPAIVASSFDASVRFNGLVPNLVGYGESLGVDMYLLDMAGISTASFANTMLPCAGFVGSGGAACSDSLFSDALHPSAAAHLLIAQTAFATVTAIPEPETVALLLMGLAVVGRAATRRRAAAAG